MSMPWSVHHRMPRIRFARMLWPLLVGISASAVETGDPYLNGLHCMGRGRYGEAVQFFSRLLPDAPQAGRACIQMVEAYKRRSAMAEASSFFRRFVSDHPDNPYGHHALGSVFRELGDDRKALEQFRLAVRMAPGYGPAARDLADLLNRMRPAESAAGELKDHVRRHPAQAAPYYGLGVLMQLQSRWDEAVSYADSALRLDPGLLEAYQVKSLACFYTGRFPELLAVNRLALEKAERAADIEAQCLFQSNLGLGHYNLSNLLEALDACTRALRISEEIGNRNQEVVNLMNMGVTCRDLGRAPEALESLNRALDRVRTSGDRRMEGRLLRNIGTVHEWVTSDFRKARDFYIMALPIARGAGDSYAEALTLWSLGSVHWALGDWDRAEVFLNDAKGKAETAGNAAVLHMCLSSLGLVSWNRARYSLALEYYGKALDLVKRSGNRLQEGAYLGNMAIVYDEMGDDGQALEYYRQALKIAVEIGDKTGEGRHLGNIAGIYQQTGRTAEAIASYRKAVDIERRVGNRKTEADFLGNLGDLYISTADYADAGVQIRRSLRLARRIGDRRCEANQYLKLGQLSSLQAGTSEALSFYRKALETNRRTFEPDIRWKAHLGIGNSLERLGRDDEALSHLRTAVETIEGIREILYTENWQTRFMERQYGAYEEIVRLLGRMHAGRPLAGFDAEAFRYAEMAKARALLGILQQGKILQTLGAVPDDLRKKLIENAGRLDRKNRSLADAYGRDGADPETAVAVEREISGLQAERVLLLDAIERRSPEIRRLIRPRLFSSDEVRATLLSGNRTILEYVVCEDKTFLWILTKRALTFKTIPMGRKTLESELAGISPLFAKDGRATAAGIDHRWAEFRTERLSALYQDLVGGPAGAALGKDSELIVVPDGLLFYLPFEILVTGKEGGRPRYLIEDHPVSYSSSASLLNPELTAGRNATKGLLAFANPERTGGGRLRLPGWERLAGRLKSAFRGGRFGPLPNSEMEVRAIAGNFRNASVYTGRRATESRLKRVASDFRILHLATHSEISEVQPMQSRIVLAESDGAGEDGDLKTLEICGLKLNADLVVLSGCGTALGKPSRGEGLIGMSRAFLHAGVPSTVASLWPVDDASTALFMKRFYACLKNGMSRTRALRQTKIECIAARDFSRDPFYWAPFVLIGDWREIDLR
jgi:CHAT domain-containing protein/tetratricopeptide (TPR) repeat protein